MLALQLLKLNASSRPPTAPRKTPNLLLLPSFLAKSRNIATSSPSARYLDQNYREFCETKLNALRQTKSAAAYSVEFATLSAPLSLNDEALCLNFYRGLHDDVKDRMAIIGRASTYAALVKQAISIDQRRHQRRLESKSESGSSSAPSNSQNKTRSSTNPPKSNPAPNLSSKPRGPLSDEE